MSTPLTCPICKSINATASLLMGSMIVWFICQDCGHVWCRPPAHLAPALAPFVFRDLIEVLAVVKA